MKNGAEDRSTISVVMPGIDADGGKAELQKNFIVECHYNFLVALATTAEGIK